MFRSISNSVRTNAKGVFWITAILSLLTMSIPLQVSAQSISAGPAHRFTSSISSQLNSRYNRQQSIATNNNASGSNSTTYYYNWSGYTVVGNTAFNEVQSTYIQPTVTCTVPNAWTLFWVGFDGYSNNTVEQSGTAAECGSTPKSVPTYYAWWEMYPTNYIQTMPIKVNPGQTIQATVSYSASNNIYGLKVANLSNGQQSTQNATCAAGLVCARDSAEWIVERPTVNGAYTPLADWGTMILGNDMASNTQSYNRWGRQYNDVLKQASTFTNIPINMVSTSSTENLLAIVSSLSRSGDSFADSWQAAQ